jgi:hypothetical protein
MFQLGGQQAERFEMSCLHCIPQAKGGDSGRRNCRRCTKSLLTTCCGSTCTLTSDTHSRPWAGRWAV